MEKSPLLLTAGNMLAGNTEKNDDKEDGMYTTGFAITAIVILLIIVGVVVSTFSKSSVIKPKVALPTPNQNRQAQQIASPNTNSPAAITSVPTVEPDESASSSSILPTSTPTPSPTKTPNPTPTPTENPINTPTPTVTSTPTSTITPTPDPTPQVTGT